MTCNVSNFCEARKRETGAGTARAKLPTTRKLPQKRWRDAILTNSGIVRAPGEIYAKEILSLKEEMRE